MPEGASESWEGLHERVPQVHVSRGKASTLAEFVEVSKKFGSVTALAGVSLAIPDGAFFSLLGPSGCGKTTLLRILAGFETADAGNVLLDGVDISRTPPERRPLNLVFQRYALFPHLTVRQNVGFGPSSWKRRRQGRDSVLHDVEDMLRLVHLEGLGDRMPGQLSGGQAQRVALARALINRPRLLLLDEPLAALDRNVRVLMRAELLRIHREVGTTFLLVTHDQDEALSMSDQVALMGDGRIEQIGTPEELYRRPVSLFAAGFIGSGSLLSGTLQGQRGERAIVSIGTHVVMPLAADIGSGDAVTVLYRPDEIKVASEADGVVQGIIEACTFHGHHYELTIATPLGEMRTYVSDCRPAGSIVSLNWDELSGVAFSA